MKSLVVLAIASGLAWGQACTQWIYNPFTGKQDCVSTGTGGGSMVYPSGSGVAVVTGGSAWGTTLPPSTIVNGQTCALGGSCTVATGGGGGGTTSGLVLLPDNGADGTHYGPGAGPTGCSAGDLADGIVYLMRPAHTSTGGATTFTYCSVAKTVVMTGGSNPNANDVVASSTSNPRMYEFVYHAAPIDKFEVMEHVRMATASEASIGTDTTLAVNMPEVLTAISAYSPLGPNLGIRFQVARTSGTAWLPSDPATFPGSGRIYRELFAVSGTALTGTRMAQAGPVGNCAAPTFAAISSSSPAQIVFGVDSTTVGHYCIVGSSGAVTWAGTEEIFDTTIDLSQITNTAYFFGLVDTAQVANTAVLNYTGGNYPGAVAGFRFAPGASDSVTWRCVAARNGSTAPMVADAGGTYGTLTGNVTQLQVRLDEASGTARWFIGAGGKLNEVCISGSWGGNLPSGSALSVHLGEYITGSVGAAPTLGVAYASIESDTVPGVRP